MKLLIVYKSVTGFTKQYAKMIAQRLTCDQYDIKKVTSDIMSNYDVIVFGGRLHAGIIDGLNKAKDMFKKSNAKEFVVFATGGMPNEAKEGINKVWRNNFSTEELEQIQHFYMQAGICYEKLPFTDKMIMKMAAKMMSKNKGNDANDIDFGHPITSSYDISSEEYIEPIVEYLMNRN